MPSYTGSFSAEHASEKPGATVAVAVSWFGVDVGAGTVEVAVAVDDREAGIVDVAVAVDDGAGSVEVATAVLVGNAVAVSVGVGLGSVENTRTTADLVNERDPSVTVSENG